MKKRMEKPSDMKKHLSRSLDINHRHILCSYSLSITLQLPKAQQEEGLSCCVFLFRKMSGVAVSSILGSR